MGRAWHSLDNIGKFYSSQAGSAVQTVFRYAATMADAVDPSSLQAAIEGTCAAFPGFNVVLRTGFFWHHLEESEVPVEIAPESLPVCQSLNVATDSPLIRVSYHHERLNLEVSHMVSDGRGTLVFFKELLRRYCAERYGVRDVPPAYTGTVAQQSQDGFRAAREERRGARAGGGADEEDDAARRPVRLRAPFRIGGRRASFDPAIYEMHLSTAAVLGRARDWDVSLTSVIIAAVVCALRDGMGTRERRRAIRVSVPVDLRARFGSETMKNFFALAFVDYLPGATDEPPCEVARAVQRDLARAIEPERLSPRMDRMVSLERNPVLRLAPVWLKDLAMAIGDRIAASRVTVSVSNLGRIKLDERLARHVRSISILTSTEGLSLTLCSLGDDLSVSVSSAYARPWPVQRIREQLEDVAGEVEVATNRAALPSVARTGGMAGGRPGATPRPRLPLAIPHIPAERRHPVARRVLAITFGSVAGVIALLALLMRWPWQATALALSGIVLHYAFFRSTFVQRPNPSRVAVRYPYVALALCLLCRVLTGAVPVASVAYPCLCLATVAEYAGLFIAQGRTFVSRYAKYLVFIGVCGLAPLAFPALGLTGAPGGFAVAGAASAAALVLLATIIAPREFADELRRLFAT